MEENAAKLSSDEGRLIRLFRCLSVGAQSEMLERTARTLLEKRLALRDDPDVERWLLDLAQRDDVNWLFPRHVLEEECSPISRVVLGSGAGAGKVLQHALERMRADVELIDAIQVLRAWRERVLTEIESAK